MSRDRWTSGDFGRSSGWPRSAAGSGPAGAGAAAGPGDRTQEAPHHKGTPADESSLHEEDLIAGGPSRPAADPAAADEQRAEVDKLRHERDEYLDSLQRLQAEFANFRKRMIREQTAQVERASQSIITSLLPVLDAADLALAHAGRGDFEADSEAISQISRLLNDTLLKEGLEKIDSEGVPFDPSIHDAVAHEPKEGAGVPAAETGEGGAKGDAPSSGFPGAANGAAAGAGAAEGSAVVADVLRPGYRLKGRTLRPAMVKVRG